jgi:hypothetical protein
MLVKIVIVTLVFIMIANLFLAMKVMLKNDPNQGPMSKYIGRRLLTSGAIVIIIIIALATGVITPNPRPY